jgi:threonine/homoserine/homoserine lactone efflux protein
MPDLSLLPLVLLAALVASATPGPATIAITTTAAAQGVRPAMSMALGVLSGSLIWSVTAALGLGAAMLSHGWIVETIRYLGAGYLMWLAWKSARAALRGGAARSVSVPVERRSRSYLRGLLLHLTNPKAIFFFGALYAIALDPGQSPATLAVIVIAVGVQSAVVFLGYAILFSRPAVRRGYARVVRWIQGLSAIIFAGFSLRLLTARLGAQ